jgi:acyl carrier protein
VRWLADGSLEYLGRNDHQIKLRGFRVELSEVEAVLAQQAGVAQALVVVHKTASEPVLLAYVVADEQTSCDGAALLRALASHLPSYMLPQQVMVLDALPRLPNGKLNRNALPLPADIANPLKRDFVAPSTPTEIALAAIWSEVLGLEQISSHDDFFTLGGHSLKALQLIARVRSSWRIELPVRAVFEASTLVELASAIDTFHHIDQSDTFKSLEETLAESLKELQP